MAVTIKHDIETIDWVIKRGDTYPVQLRITNDDNTPVDLTDFILEGDARTDNRSPQLFSLPITILDQTVDANLGWCEIILDSEFTSGLGQAGQPSKFKYDIQITYPHGGGVFTIIEGTWDIQDDYTRAGSL